MRVLLRDGGRDCWDAAGRLGVHGAPARIVVPAGPEQLAPRYDLTIGQSTADLASFSAFDGWLAEAAGAHGLTCAVLHDGIVHEAIRRLGQGELTIGLHLEYAARWHRPENPCARLAQAVADAGGCPVNPPARSRLFSDKSLAHTELVRRGLGVPDTVLFRPWMPDRPLSAAERARLRLDEPGARLYVKAANGCGDKGVIRTDPESVTAALSAARAHDRQDTYLVQRQVCCPWLECNDGVERPACWRVLCCLGELLPFWWSRPEDRGAALAGEPGYRPLAREEVRCHRLRSMLAYAAELARLSGLEWFSTELCLSDGPEPSRYRVRADGNDWAVLAIDYLNDQCSVDVQSRWPGAVPDAAVRHIAWRFAEAAWLWRQTTAPAWEGAPQHRAA